MYLLISSRYDWFEIGTDLRGGLLKKKKAKNKVMF